MVAYYLVKLVCAGSGFVFRRVARRGNGVETAVS